MSKSKPNSPSSANQDFLSTMRHSAEHVLMHAMSNLFPNQFLMAMGPSTPEGFYFDFQPVGNFKLSEKDFPRIEKEMRRLIKLDLPIGRQELSPAQAKKLFSDNPYKQEWISEAESRGDPITVYWTGKPNQADSFVDLCAGPHVKSTGQIGAVKLLSIAGAYWRGDENNQMLTRIYGTAFPTQSELKTYLHNLEEAKKRDHRKLGPQLDLFVINENIGKGLPLLTPKGTIIRNQILSFEKELEAKAGFQEVWTPHIAKNDLYKLTGHWDHYQDVMYAPFGIDKETYVLKPMNCPHHYMIYQSRPRSYRDLPIRLSEPGTCYRYEKSGELGGLTRVRALTIDDSHILMRGDQIEQEFFTCIHLIRQMFQALGLKNYSVRLSLNDPSDQAKYISDPKTWKLAGRQLESIIKQNRLDYQVGTGEASFYGPKIDFMVTDAIGRQWQMSTLQLDLFMAKRLNLTYTDKNNREVHPVILHRGLTGSIERTIGLLIEHFAGAFPLWLAPVQVCLIPINQKHSTFAQKILHQLTDQHIRAELRSQGSMQKRIRSCEKEKIPFMVIIGDNEVKNYTLAVRQRSKGDLGSINPEEFVSSLLDQISRKVID